jgi:exopolysaccharide biosynthesis polyprenyl glycosylphosphotransferase
MSVTGRTLPADRLSHPGRSGDAGGIRHAGGPPAVHAGRLTRGALVRRALVLADIIGLIAAFLIAELFFGDRGQADRVSPLVESILFAATIPGWLVLAKLYRLYDHDDERTDHSTVDDLVAVVHLATVGAWLVFVVAWASGAASPATTRLVVFWALVVVLVTAARAAARAVCRHHPAYLQRALVLGGGEVGQLIARKLIQHKEYGIELVGLVDSDPRERRTDLEHVPLLGPSASVVELALRHGVERVIVAFSGDPTEETVDNLGRLESVGVQVDIVPRFFDVVGPHAVLQSVEGIPVLSLPPAKRFPLSRSIKRLGDVVGASLALIVAAPLMAYIAIRIRRDSPGPVFFRQQRLGEGMREFTLVKFRTMRVGADDAPHREFIKQTMSSEAAPTANGLYKLERDDAITPFGRWLRKTSLDELPQLLNVLRGEMSLVGPRPCLAYETEHFEPHHFERFGVPQGITGLWQVTARAHATFGEALDMDVVYARNWSLGLDLRIIARTPLHLLRRKGTA